MPKKAADAAKIKGQLKTYSLQLDTDLLPFILAIAPGTKASVSAGVRAAVRSAIRHTEQAGHWPPRYIEHMLRHNKGRADAYLTRWPDQAPEGYTPPAPDAFEGWND